MGWSTPIGVLVDLIAVALTHGDHQHHQPAVLHLVDESKSGGAQLDLVALRMAAQP